MTIKTHTGGMAATNAYLHEDQGKKLLIDAPEDTLEWLVEEDAQIDAAFLTHQHYDHVQGLSAVVEKYSCPVYAFCAYSKELTLAVEIEQATGLTELVPPYEIDHPLKNEAVNQEVMIAGTQWQLLHLPGHSSDSLALYNPDQSILFSGDVLFAGSIGRTDFQGSDHQQLLESLSVIKSTISPQTKIYSGHGPVTTMSAELASNPFLQ